VSLKPGDLVRVLPLNQKVGRVIGGQLTARQGSTLYLVRYEVENATVNRRSESSLYFEDELVLVV
jgi:hypothetical protein